MSDFMSTPLKVWGVIAVGVVTIGVVVLSFRTTGGDVSPSPSSPSSTVGPVVDTSVTPSVTSDVPAVTVDVLSSVSSSSTALVADVEDRSISETDVVSPDLEAFIASGVGDNVERLPADVWVGRSVVDQAGVWVTGEGRDLGFVAGAVGHMLRVENLGLSAGDVGVSVQASADLAELWGGMYGDDAEAARRAHDLGLIDLDVVDERGGGARPVLPLLGVASYFDGDHLVSTVLYVDEAGWVDAAEFVWDGGAVEWR